MFRAWFLAELRETRSECACAVPVGRAELRAGAAHVRSDEVDETTLVRREVGSRGGAERVIERAALQALLAQL
jgi:hypothetical protein